jgi:hypothetical protein
MDKELSMSNDELKNLTHRLDEIIKDGQDREKKHDLAHKQFTVQMTEISNQNKRQFQMLEPMYNIFTSVKGFNGISVWILKALILIGAGVGVLYGLIKYLKS